MELKRTAVFMRFKTPFRVGQRGTTLEETDKIIRSDTLFSALIWSAYYLGGLKKANEILEKFLQNKIRISSSFPFIEKKNRLELFFPKLILPLRKIVESVSEIKRVKRAELLPKELFEKIINGEKLNEKDIDGLEKKLDELSRFVKIIARPRVTLDRVDASSMLYHAFGMYYGCSEDGASGLYFMLECEEELFDEIQSLLNLLRDQGIGGERTYGWGAFEYTIREIIINVPDEASAYASLSLVSPNKEEWERIAGGESNYYSLIIRGGWTIDPQTFKPLRKKSLIMLSEGSVFSFRIEGSIQDVTPEGFTSHKVYKYGRAFLIPIRIRGD
ncbi:MAG: type III-A CRISPR-associated RAMP protein Csm4 [Candidatus Njordarchaeales archaeon]